jgi:glucose-1-phosphate thymidylyltransferase
MKALILAGGRGTRLRPLTHTSNKHLLPIGNEPMIYRVIKDVVDAGISDIIININKGDKSIEESVSKRDWGDVEFHYIEQEEPNGMMYPIVLARELLAGEDFILHAGDNILAGGLKQHVQKFSETDCDAMVLVTKVKKPERFSVYTVEGDVAKQVVEKPKEYVGDLAGTAIYFYRGDAIFAAMDAAKPIDPEGKGKPEYFPPVAHQWMIDNNFTIKVSEITGWWKDTGKPNDLLLANRLVLEKKEYRESKGKVESSEIEGDVEIMEGAVIRNSKLRGPISIGKDAVIEDAYIGPFTSIGANSVIENAQIENSILLEGVTVKNLQTRLDSSLMGWNAEIREKEEFPRASSFFVGDNSIVEL